MSRPHHAWFRATDGHQGRTPQSRRMARSNQQMIRRLCRLRCARSNAPPYNANRGATPHRQVPLSSGLAYAQNAVMVGRRLLTRRNHTFWPMQDAQPLMIGIEETRRPTFT
eukprot:1667900-Pyramimonas_sp.AAC.1